LEAEKLQAVSSRYPSKTYHLRKGKLEASCKFGYCIQNHNANLFGKFQRFANFVKRLTILYHSIAVSRQIWYVSSFFENEQFHLNKIDNPSKNIL